MSKFRKCPRCGNHEKGYTVYRCKRCSKHWCHKSGGLFSSSTGCGAMRQTCPHCGGALKTGTFSFSFSAEGSIG